MSGYWFIADDWITIGGRGRMATFNADKLPEGMCTAAPLLGERVTIDGTEYLVKGVETCRVNHAPGHRCTMGFGLLVSAGLGLGENQP